MNSSVRYLLPVLAFFLASVSVSAQVSPSFDNIDLLLQSLEQKLMTTEDELNRAKLELDSVKILLAQQQVVSADQLAAYNKLYSRYEKLELSSRLWKKVSIPVLIIETVAIIILELR